MFAKDKYSVIKQAISNEKAKFAFDYLNLKARAVKHLYSNALVAETDFLGTFRDEQVPNTYSIYGDFLMETLLQDVLPIMNENTELNLYPTYAYARVYEEGCILEKHKDRPSCEISTTLNLGGDLWPIYLENTKVDLNQGDMLIYKGCELEHWREKFTGKNCTQVFLHYNRVEKDNKKNLYDGRFMLGLPASTR